MLLIQKRAEGWSTTSGGSVLNKEVKKVLLRSCCLNKERKELSDQAK